LSIGEFKGARGEIVVAQDCSCIRSRIRFSFLYNFQGGIAGQMAPLQRGTLEVWVPKTFVAGLMTDPAAHIIVTYQWTLLMNEFKRDFPAFDLHFKIMERDEFVAAVHSSLQNPPDVAFLDNDSELRPLIDTVLQMPTMAQSRFSDNGSWTIFRQAKNLEASKTFLLWVSRSPHWRPPQLNTKLMGSTDTAAVQSASKDAVRLLNTGNRQSFSALMDSGATSFNWDFPKTGRFSTIDPVIYLRQFTIGFRSDISGR
jgi:hypothetical protein